MRPTIKTKKRAARSARKNRRGYPLRSDSQPRQGVEYQNEMQNRVWEAFSREMAYGRHW